MHIGSIKPVEKLATNPHLRKELPLDATLVQAQYVAQLAIQAGVPIPQNAQIILARNGVEVVSLGAKLATEDFSRIKSPSYIEIGKSSPQEYIAQTQKINAIIGKQPEKTSNSASVQPANEPILTDTQASVNKKTNITPYLLAALGAALLLGSS